MADDSTYSAMRTFPKRGIPHFAQKNSRDKFTFSLKPERENDRERTKENPTHLNKFDNIANDDRARRNIPPQFSSRQKNTNLIRKIGETPDCTVYGDESEADEIEPLDTGYWSNSLWTPITVLSLWYLLMLE